MVKPISCNNKYSAPSSQIRLSPLSIFPLSTVCVRTHHNATTHHTQPRPEAAPAAGELAKYPQIGAEQKYKIVSSDNLNTIINKPLILTLCNFHELV